MSQRPDREMDISFSPISLPLKEPKDLFLPHHPQQSLTAWDSTIACLRSGVQLKT